MKRIKVFLNKLFYGEAEPDIAQNPTVRRRFSKHSMTLYDRADNTKIGKYEVY